MKTRRSTNKIASKQDLVREFERLAAQNQETVERRESVLEKHASAMFLRKNLPAPPIAELTLREISHVHLHGTLSLPLSGSLAIENASCLPP